eukprot:COSAG02_NODE_2017_length_10096_cov_52.537061_4_plen_204_part_00
MVALVALLTMGWGLQGHGGDVIGLMGEFNSGTKASLVLGANFTARGAGCVEWATGEVTGLCPAAAPDPGSGRVKTDDGTHPNTLRMARNASKTVPILYSWSAFESEVQPWNGTALVAVGSGRVQVDNATTPWGGPGVDAFLWCELRWAGNTMLSLTASSENRGLFGGTGPSVTCEGSAGCCSVVAVSQRPCPSCGMCCFAEHT